MREIKSFSFKMSSSTFSSLSSDYVFEQFSDVLDFYNQQILNKVLKQCLTGFKCLKKIL